MSLKLEEYEDDLVIELEDDSEGQPLTEREQFPEMVEVLLTEREALIVKTVCGYTEEGPLSTEEIAGKLNISKDRVEQILRKALRKLTPPRNRSKILSEFIEE